MEPRIRRHRTLMRVVVVLTLTLVLLPNVATATSAPATAADPLGTGLGTSQKAFEAKYGKPTSTESATDFATGVQYAIPGYKSVFVYWHNGFAAHIVLNSRSSWTEQKAVDIGTRFLPTDSRESGQATTRADGSVLALGHSPALARRFSAATYTTYGVGGKQGDLRVLFIPAMAGGATAATIDIAIGTGAELAGPTAAAPRELTDEELTYLATVRANVDELDRSLSLYFDTWGPSAFLDQTVLSDPEKLAALYDLVAVWQNAGPKADALSVPAGFETFHASYLEAANKFSSIGDDFARCLDSGGRDSLSLMKGSTVLVDAIAQLNPVRDQLNKLGV